MVIKSTEGQTSTSSSWLTPTPAKRVLLCATFYAIPAVIAAFGGLALIHLKGGHSLGFLNPLLEKMGTKGARICFISAGSILAAEYTFAASVLIKTHFGRNDTRR